LGRSGRIDKNKNGIIAEKKKRYELGSRIRITFLYLGRSGRNEKNKKIPHFLVPMSMQGRGPRGSWFMYMCIFHDTTGDLISFHQSTERVPQVILQIFQCKLFKPPRFLAAVDKVCLWYPFHTSGIAPFLAHLFRFAKFVSRAFGCNLFWFIAFHLCLSRYGCYVPVLDWVLVVPSWFLWSKVSDLLCELHIGLHSSWCMNYTFYLLLNIWDCLLVFFLLIVEKREEISVFLFLVK
jgi:hypothetical protein